MNSVILGSSSKGNAILYNNVLVDCGVAFSKLKHYVNEIDYVLLTHIHKDHFNKSSLIELAIAKPEIRFICCDWLENELRKIGITNITVVELNSVLELQFSPKILVSPFMLYHDVKNCGWRIMFGKYKVFHATDTESLDGIEARGYDCYAIEHNYDEDTIYDIIREKKENGEHSYEEGAINSHLSFQQAQAFIKANATKEYLMFRLHISARYNENNITISEIRDAIDKELNNAKQTD